MPDYLFTLPTVASVVSAARLRPEQFDPKLSQLDFEGEVQARIERAVDGVEDDLLTASRPLRWPYDDAVIATAYPDYTPAERLRFNQRQQANATESTRLLAAAMLLSESVQANEAYAKRAAELEKRAKAIVAALVATAEFVVEEQGKSGGAAQAITPVRIDPFSSEA